MSILDKSSLVMIPSGYKEDKLYSVKPRNGDGDFTFTRASTGTRVNADGYIEDVPWNIVSYSEDYSSGSWVATNLSVTTDDTTSPRGDTTADKITTTSSGVETRIRNSSFYQTPSTQHTFSAYAKKGNVNWFLLRNIAYGSSKRAWFDLENGVVGTVNSGLTATIEDVGDGWFRCSVTGTTTSSPTQIIDFSSAPNDNDFQSDAVGEFCYVWGVQLVKGNTSKTYIKTTDRLDIPRLDYSGGASCPTLLLEPQRTNSIAYSEDYSSGNWNTSNTTITPNSIIAPSGLNVGSLITANGTNPRLTYNVGVGTGSFVFSWFAKKGTSSYLKVRVYDGSTNHDAVFDLENGTITSGNGIIEPYINGWFRCSLIYTSNGYTHFTQTWISNTSSGNLYLWGAQLEQGSFPTSYIPTSGTSVTRVADVSETSGLSSLINSQEGVLFLEIKSLGFDTQNRAISIYDGISTNGHLNRVQIGYFGSDQISFLYRTISGNVFLQNINVTQQQTNKFALKYKENDFSAYINGVKVAEQSSGSVVAVGTFTNIATHNGNDVSNFFGKCNQLILFNEALTDTELEELTTI